MAAVLGTNEGCIGASGGQPPIVHTARAQPQRKYDFLILVKAMGVRRKMEASVG